MIWCLVSDSLLHDKVEPAQFGGDDTKNNLNNVRNWVITEYVSVCVIVGMYMYLDWFGLLFGYLWN